MLHVFYLDVCVYGYNGFQVFFRCFFKCFKSMFQVFQLPSDVCCNWCIWMFQSRSVVASLVPTFCCIVSPDADRASIQHRCRVLSNRRRRAPFSSCRSGGAGPTWSAKQSVARGRPNVWALALPYAQCSGVKPLVQQKVSVLFTLERIWSRFQKKNWEGGPQGWAQLALANGVGLGVQCSRPKNNCFCWPGPNLVQPEVDFFAVFQNELINFQKLSIHKVHISRVQIGILKSSPCFPLC
jgi:hypothetical protein